jgi:hypothetical protein
MLQQTADFYLQQPEPNQSFMLGLRQVILDLDDEMTEHWKWRLPFFYYKNKPYCYIWKDAKTQQPYLGFVKGDRIEHALLYKGNRKKMKIFSFDNKEDIPVLLLKDLFQLLKPFYA